MTDIKDGCIYINYLHAKPDFRRRAGCRNSVAASERRPILISSDDLISLKSVRLGHDEEGHVSSVSSAVHSVDHGQQGSIPNLPVTLLSEGCGQLVGSACMASLLMS